MSMNWFYSLKIKYQLLLLTLLVALPAAAVIVYTGIEARSRAIDDAYEETGHVVERIAADQQRIAHAAEHLLHLLSQLSEVRQQDAGRLEPLLGRIMQLNDHYFNILVTDRNGTVLASALPQPERLSVADRRAFRNAVALGRFASGEYVVSKHHKQPLFNFGYPYRDAAGSVKGVVMVAIRLDRYGELLSLNTQHKEANFLLVDRQGIILTRGLGAAEVIGKPCPEASFRQMRSGPESGVFRGPGLTGEERFMTYRRLQLAGETEPYLYVRAGLPVRAVLAASNREIARNLGLLAGGLLAALILANLIGKRSIADRIEALRQAFKKLGEGRLEGGIARQIRGGELGLLAQGFDEMARRLHERETHLQEQQAQLRGITDSAQDAILMMDDAGSITFWNPAAEAILGYRQDEALGSDLHRLLAPKRYWPAYQASLAAFAGSGRGAAVSRTVELAAVRSDGREITVSLSLSSFQLQGRWHAVGVLRDITDQKQHQQELEQARRAAEAANHAKSEFLANMSHEIRTPLNGVIGMVQLLQFTSPDKEQEEYLHYLDLSAKGLLALLNDILDLSKIEAGRIDLEHAAFSPHQALREVLANLEYRVRQKGLDLNIDIDAQVPEILRGDGLRFKQILLNLLGNAVKFTESGGITVTMTVRSRQEGNCLLETVVADTGIGMDDETLKRIFAPFEQADTSTTRRYGGSGLGLTICTRLVGLMGGTIHAASQPGRGSRFMVALPFEVPQLSAADEPQAEETLPPSERRLKVLVAEDNELNRATVLAMLERLGHEAEAVPDGQAAIERWNRFSFNCILMDISMPLMDGRQATAAIREQESKMGGHTPVIALTAHALQGDRERLLAEGFDGYLAKPVQLHELSGELQRVTAVRSQSY